MTVQDLKLVRYEPQEVDMEESLRLLCIGTGRGIPGEEVERNEIKSEG